jgi:hypothetical protein
VANYIINRHCLGFGVLKMKTRIDTLLKVVIATDIQYIQISIRPLYPRSLHLLSILLLHSGADVTDETLFVNSLDFTYVYCLIQPVHRQHPNAAAVVIQIVMKVPIVRATESNINYACTMYLLMP